MLVKLLQDCWRVAQLCDSPLSLGDTACCWAHTELRITTHIPCKVTVDTPAVDERKAAHDAVVDDHLQLGAHGVGQKKRQHTL